MDQEAREAAAARAIELQRARRYAEAVEILEPLTQPAVTMQVAVALGVCLQELGRFEAAARWLGVAARHRPDNPAVRRMHGNLLAEMGRTIDAEREFRAALAVKPDDDATLLALGGLLLSLGRYAEGWPMMEARTRLNVDSIPPIALPYPPWRGEPLAGRSILVWYEQGLGDQIQFARFARNLKARGAAQVSLGCRPPLADLLATAPGVDRIIPAPLSQTISVDRHDYWTRYFSLPGPLGIGLADLWAGPYLSAPAERQARWRGYSGVGLAWKASPTGFNGENKGLPDAVARRLLDRGAISLDPEDTGVGDFADTAAIVEQLDLVISIDTSVAHLAGAMGKPVWTLLPRLHTDWRWLRGRTDSPWYPTMRLYRQREAGQWDEAMDQVLADLDVL